MPAPPRCPLCESDGPFAQPASPAGFQLYDCARCGMVFLHPLPTEDELSLYYNQEYYGAGRKKFFSLLEVAIRQLTAMKWRRLLPYTQSGHRMLDIGCGRGTMVDLAREQGLEAYGLERNFPHGQRNPHIFYKDLFECGFDAGHFHLVVLWHVLEHLADPRKTLAEIHRIVTPGGYLSLAVPNYGGAQAKASGRHWFHLDIPRHFWHFRDTALMRLLEEAGFELVRQGTYSFEYDWFGALQSWLNSAAADDNTLFGVLKGERPVGSVAALRSVALGSLLAAPALGKALLDAARGRGGTLFLLLRKPA